MTGTTSLTFAAIVMLLAAGCGDDAGPVKGDTLRHDAGAGKDAVIAKEAGADLAKSDAPVVVSFATSIQPIFTASCVGCHGGSSPSGQLNLAAGSAYAELSKDSVQCPTRKRVKPGDPAESYLVHKLTGAGSCFTGQKMPVGGSLSAAQLGSITSWIQAGAPNN